MRILLSGAYGFIGSHLYSRLTQNEVTLLDRNARLGEGWPNLENYDVVIHLAADVGVKKFSSNYESFRNNYDMDVELIKALETCENQPHVIYASSSEVYGSNLDAKEDADFNILSSVRGSYALEKAITETALRAVAKNYSILRFFNVTGADHDDKNGHVLPSFVKRILKGEEITLYNGGEDIRTFAHVDDVVNVIVSLLTRPVNGALNVGSGRDENTTSIKELAALIGTISGKEVKTKVEETDASLRIEKRKPNVEKLNGLGLICNTSLEDIVRSSVEFWSEQFKNELGAQTLEALETPEAPEVKE